MRILVVEDEKEMAQGIKGILNCEGYEVDIADNGLYGLDLIIHGRYDLVLLDLMIPKMSGIRVLENIRAKGMDIPVIVLTAKSQTEDKIKGLDCGADDYLVKPFDVGELLARIRARIRKLNNCESSIIDVYDIRLDGTTYKLIKKERSVKLSNKEYIMMEYFMRNRGIILSRDIIATRVWGYDEEIEYNSVDVYVSFLRKKLNFIKADTIIVTKKGVGYSLEDRSHD